MIQAIHVVALAVNGFAVDAVRVTMGGHHPTAIGKFQDGRCPLTPLTIFPQWEDKLISQWGAASAETLAVKISGPASVVPRHQPTAVIQRCYRGRVDVAPRQLSIDLEAPETTTPSAPYFCQRISS